VNWRLAIAFGAIFICVGTLYFVTQKWGVDTRDLEGVTLLLVLGIAMAFGFVILLRGSRDL
jgi:hypothetical protein